VPSGDGGAARFVGTVACLACHVEAEEVFKTTKHPRGYATLVEVGKQHHLDCIGCHVTGWQQPQGVCRIDQTAGRETWAARPATGRETRTRRSP